MFPFFSLPKPAAPSNKATTTTTQQQPQQPVVKTFGKKSTQLAPSTSFGPFDRENFEPSVRNQERERDHPPMVKTSSIVKTSSLLRINVEDVNNAVENSGPLSTMSQDSNQSGKGSKKRNSETECEPKNTRQRLSPFPGGGSSRSASGSTPTFEFSSSLSSNASTITTGTRGSKNKQKMKGKKYYSSCILQADNEDINYLKAALDNKVNFTPCIFIPTEFTEEKRIRFALFIESIGFVRNKGDAYYFSNNDLDELHQALQNKDDLPPISSSTFGMLERSRSKSLQSTLSHIDASIDNRLRSTSCAPLIDASPRYERQGSEDGSDCGTPRSMHALSIDDFPSANSNSGRSSTPLGESFLHGWDTKLNLSTGLSPRYPNMDKPFGRSSSISSHTMTEKMTIGANHKRSTSKGTDPFLPMGPPPPPNSATPFPPQPTTTSIMSQQYFNPAMGIASGRNDSFPFFQEESPPSSTSSMAISFHESTSNGPPLTMSETPAVASSPSTGLLSAFIPPKKTLPRKSSAGNSVQMNSDPSPATPALFNAAKANQCFDNYATPQGRVFCAAKYLESKATDSTSIEYLRTKLIKRWQQIQDQKRATMKSELSVSSSISIDSADSSSAAVSVQSTSTLMNSNQANNLQNSDFHRPSVVNISTAPFNPTPFTSAAFSKQTQQSLFDRSFQELGRAGSLELSGNYKLSYEHKQDLLQQQSFTDFQMMKTFDPPPSITLERGASLGGGARVGAVHLASSAAMSLLNNSLNSSSGSPRNHLLGDSVVNAQHFDNSIYVSDEETQTNLHFSHYHQSMSRSNDSAFLTTNHMNHPAISLGAGRGSSTQLMSLDEELDLIGDSFVCHSPSNTFGKTLQGGVRSNRNRQSFFSAKTNKKLSIKKLGKARRQSLFPISERSRLEMSHISLGMNDSQLDDSKSIMIEREGAMTTTTIATNLTGTPDSISSKHKEPLSPIPASQSPMGTPRQLHQSMVLESSNISHSQGSIRRQLRYSLSPLQRSYQMEASNAMGLLSPSLKGGLAMAQLQSSIFTPLFRTSLLIICDCFTNEELLTHVSKVNKILHLFALQTIIKRKDIGANMLKIVGQTRTHRRGGSASSKAAASSHLMQWNDFSNYLSMHRSGYFLGEGACKRVYHVKQSGTNLEKALSIMDVKDMIDRGMEQAIAKEIEITLLCSSLMKFRICPQMIRVFNIFQSNFDPSEKLWKGPSQQNHALKPSISNAEFIKTSLSWSSLSSSSLYALENQTQSNMMMKSTSSITVNNSSVANIPIDKKNCTKGTYQFIEMEFCSCGDVETFLRSMGVPSLVLVKSMLFQMLYSLYCGRVIYTLRHFDIKLLNFFLYKLPLKCDAVVASSDYEGITKSQALIIGFEDLLYRLPFLPDPAAIPNQDVSSSSCMYMIKLGDFGTGVIDHPLDTPVTIQQFTTLENSPPEFLILGERNSQNYSSDTFNLGLCLFHLLNGIAPYEELLEDVRCPEFFISRWQKSWEADPVILEVVESLLPEDDEIEDDDNMIEEEDEDDVILENMMDEDDHDNNKTKKKNEKTAEEENPFLIFCHTLYRFLVLFSGCECFTEGFVKNRMYQDSAIWRVIVDTFSLYEKLDQVDQRSFTRMKLKKNDHKLQEICKQQFFKDASRWSFHQGNDPVIRSARQRAEELTGGLEGIKLLDSLLHWDPNQRCTMYEALKSPIFYNFCIDPSNCYQPFSNQPAMKFDCFMRRNEYDRIPVVQQRVIT